MQVKFSKTLGKNYVVLEDCFITEDGVLFDKMENANVTSANLKKKYAEALAEGLLYDYAFARSTGAKRRKRDTAKEVEDRVSLIQDAEAEGERGVIIALRWIMLSVGVASTFVTGANLYNSLSQALNTGVSLLFSVSMALFLTGSFESFIVFKRQRMYGLASIIIICFLVTITYSISAEMEVLYRGFYEHDRAYTESFLEDNASSLSATAVLAVLDEEIRTAEEAYNRSIAEYDRYTAQDTIASWRVAELKQKIDADNGVLTKKRVEKRKLIEEKPETTIVVKGAEKKVSFIDFVSEIFGWDARKIRFFRDMLPALFIDFISPISVSVAMFIGGTGSDKGKRKRVEGTEEAGRKNTAGSRQAKGVSNVSVLRRLQERGRGLRSVLGAGKKDRGDLTGRDQAQGIPEQAAR